MSCNLTSGILKGCRDNAGGIVEAYIGNFPTGYTSNEWYEESGGTITSISGVSLFQFEPNKQSSNWEEAITASNPNGTIGYDITLTLVFAKNDADKRNAIKAMGQANLIVIVRDKNEKYWLLGPQEGIEVNGGNSSSGTVLNDLNGWSITLGGSEPQPAMEVSSSIISGLLS